MSKYLQKFGKKCKNHKTVNAVTTCERCHKPICELCVVTDIHYNFIIQFFARKGRFEEHSFCPQCAKFERRLRFITAIALLMLFTIIPLLFILLIP